MSIIPRDLVSERGAGDEDADELEDAEESVELLEGEELLPKILTVTQFGFGKRTKLSSYSVQNRNGKGVITIKTNARNGDVVGASLVYDEDELMLVTNHGQIIRMAVEGISVIGRNTQGVKLMTMDPEEEIVSIARLIKEDEDEELEDGEEGEEITLDAENEEERVEASSEEE